MKYTLLLMVLFFLACVSSTLTGKGYLNQKERVSAKGYEVYKIDSINTYYLIYAKRGDSLYKIVSKKNFNRKCTEIKSGLSYDFKLHSSLKGFIGNIAISAKQLPHVNCYSYDDSTEICLEKDSITDLYHADNIQGLCYIK
ncbi:hypothetical protein [Pedobacter metabolipauper]|uniref:Lipoprotein n=1 Tax=Pedobacter metabolipauper TaxID=425513 RepID=A0A4R6STH2_9SPHI|nr:hypothetical protein [Pedobacter metabolipauper]TDQ07715.1 hypothetical protein ATK78_3844 [Pedobacter metabolipauper]